MTYLTRLDYQSSEDDVTDNEELVERDEELPPSAVSWLRAFTTALHHEVRTPPVPEGEDELGRRLACLFEKIRLTPDGRVPIPADPWFLKALANLLDTGREIQETHIGRRMEPWLTRLADRIGRRVTDKVGAHPYWASALVTMVTGVGAYFLYRTWYLLAAVVLLVAMVGELLDAAIAKQAKVAQRAVLVDYVADRFGDVVLFGLLTLYGLRHDGPVAVLAYGTLLASLLGSYVRAQAEALRFARPRSRFGRAERILCVVIATWGAVIVHPVWSLRIGLVCAALVTLVSLVCRFVHAVRQDHVEISTQFSAWAPEEFLPRVIDALQAHSQSPVALVREEGVPKGADTTDVIAVIERRPVGAIVRWYLPPEAVASATHGNDEEAM